MNKFQLVRVSYKQYHYFKVPLHIDLEDTTQVREYWVKYGTLFIRMVDGSRVEVDYGVEDVTNDYAEPEEDSEVCITPEDIRWKGLAEEYFGYDSDGEEDEKIHIPEGYVFGTCKQTGKKLVSSGKVVKH
jgi:hypothetical protein